MLSTASHTNALKLTIFGAVLALLGVIANPWTLERVFANDHEISSRFFWGLIFVIDAILVVGGLALIRLSPFRHRALRFIEDAPQPSAAGRRMLMVVGLLFIVAGFLLNEWFISHFLFTIKSTNSQGATQNTTGAVRAVVWAVDMLFVAVGCMVLAFGPVIHRYREGIAISLVTVIILVGGLEGVTRLWLFKMASDEQFLRYANYEQVGKRGWANIMPDPLMVYRPMPGYMRPYGLNRHNSLGYRGADVQVSKPDGIFRIVTVGGSATYDVGINDWRQTYPAQLESILSQQYGCGYVQVINAGVSGYDSFLILKQLRHRILDLKPDLIIYNENFNDISARYVDPAAYRSDGSGRVGPWRLYPDGVLVRNSVFTQVVLGSLGMPPQRSLYDAVFNNKAYHVEATLAGNDAEAAALLAANPPIYLESNLKEYITLARENNAIVLLASYAYSPLQAEGKLNAVTQQEIGRQNLLIQSVATSMGTPFFDLASKMRPDVEYWWDHTHSTEKGAHLKAELFAQGLAEQGLLPATCKSASAVGKVN